MAEAPNGNCTLYYDTFGSPAHPTLLLVNGLGSQCINFDDTWCEMFANEGFHVVRFDNRDVGLSTHFEGDDAAYTLVDMAGDATAVLDHLGVERAHVCGLSLGGMIVQTMAILHRDRLLSMTSIMSRTGESGYGESTPEALAILIGSPPTDRKSAIDNHIVGQRTWGSPAFADESRWERDAGRAFDRSFDPGGVRRQFLAVGASSSRSDDLPLVTTPTLVIHGNADTLIDISGGRRTADLIPGSKLIEIDGMGHDYPPQLWPVLTEHITGFCLRIF